MRRTSLLFRFLAASIFLLLATGRAYATDWWEFKSDNFIVYSNADENDAYDLIEEIEYFRYYLSLVTNVESTSSEIPLTIFALRNHISFKSMTGVGGGTLGFYFTHPRGGVSFLDLSFDFGIDGRFPTQPGKQVLFHEYTHFFLRQFSPFRYPRWFDEGFAEYLGAFTYNDGVAVLGQIIPGRLRSIGGARFLPLDHLFASNTEIDRRVTNRGAIGQFYAQSWFLVHYLQHNPAYRVALQEYIRDINLGVPYKEAYSRHFPVSMKKLKKELTAYLKEGKIPYVRLTITEEQFKPSIAVRALPLEEAEFVQLKAKAFLFFDDKRMFARKNVLADAIKTSPYKWDLQVMLAELELFDLAYDEAEALARQVVEEAPETAYAHGLLGSVLINMALRESDAARRQELFREGRDRLREAIRRDPLDVDAWTSLGESYAYGPQDDLDEARQAFERALDLLPQRESTWFGRALVDVKREDFDPALFELDRLAKWANGRIKRAAAFCAKDIRENGTDHACRFENLDKFSED